ncbi:uncharacterized protein LOC125045304 [Penaeus chinensis]|uniref:uncharacterized protein LOC125045304 n=1 Tax=Penaeus chinensis TaxID=139456 RepID=UPI001FB7E181|nr:uncharacterized protein LOC125045304 [Penaeus chinensis]
MVNAASQCESPRGSNRKKDCPIIMCPTIKRNLEVGPYPVAYMAELCKFISLDPNDSPSEASAEQTNIFLFPISYGGGFYKNFQFMLDWSTVDAPYHRAHLKFRECVLDTTPLKCDAVSLSSADQTVTQFTREMLDRALGFLLKECKHFVPNNRDCPRSSLGVHHGNAGGTNAYGNGGNEDNYSGYNDNQLHPDATTNRPSNTFPFTTSSTSRFTWTTKGNPDGVTPTADFSGNFLDGAESQQYRGAGSTLMLCLSTQIALVLSWALAVRLY